jgi:hypothetical protein
MNLLLDIAKPLVSLPVKVASTAVGQADALVRRLRGGTPAVFGPAEPSPSELASNGRGRQPAPLGNTGVTKTSI